MTSWLLDKKDDLLLKEEDGADSVLGTPYENYLAASENDRLNEIGGSKAEAFNDAWSPIIDEIHEKGGPLFRNPGSVVYNQRHYDQRQQRIFKYVEENADRFPDLADLRERNFEETATKFARQSREEFEELNARSPGLSNTLAQFGGSAVAFFKDPAMLTTLPAGLVGLGTKPLLSIAVREAALGAGTEAINQIGVKQWYDELGYDYGYGDFIARVGLAGAFGASLPVAISGAGKTVSATAGQLKKGYQALKKAGAPETPSMRAAESAIETIEDLEANNPLAAAGAQKVDQLDADIEHQARSAQADEAVLFNTLPDIPNVPAAAVSDTSFDVMGGPVSGARDFDPDELGVDAELFQYKSGGDQYGVTEALKGVTQWDQVRAGTALVYEFADGRKVVADGHQRLGLAKRIKDQDPTQQPKIHAYTKRQVDGWTVEEVRVIAALKNIAEGSGKPVDAAKVLRVDPSKIDDLNLPTQSALVRQARDLVNLSDNSFMLVVNGVVPSNYAAIVGRMIPDDPDLQEAALRVLASQEPSNEFQAQAMVSQIREVGAEKMTQDGLFGEEVFAESFFLERAKVLDRAQKEIRKDKAAFSNITRNAERLEAEGNILEKTNNQRRISDEQKTLQLLQALANSKGPISEALTAAARAARESGSYGGPTRKFLDDVRAAVAAGDLDRLAASDVGRFVDDPGQVSPVPEKTEPDIELFDEPGGQGVDRQAKQLEENLITLEEDAQAFLNRERIREEAKKIEDRVMDLNSDSPAARVKLQDFDDESLAAHLEEMMQIRQGFVSVEDIMVRGEKNHQILNTDLDQITADLGIPFTLTKINDKVTVPPLKKEKDVRRKLVDKYGAKKGDPNPVDVLHNVTDVARSGINIRSPKDYEDVVEALIAKGYNVLDEGFASTPAGYFDAKVLVQAKDGMLMEVQFWPPGMYAAKETADLTEFGYAKTFIDAETGKEKPFVGGHNLYKIEQNRDKKATKADIDRATRNQNILYGRVVSELPESFDPILLSKGIERRSTEEIEALFSAADREISGDLSSSNIRAGDTGSQDLDTEFQIKAADESSETAASDIPSTRKNLTSDTSTDILSDLDTVANTSQELPTGRVIQGEDGEMITETQTLAELKREFEHDEEVLNRFKDCVL